MSSILIIGIATAVVLLLVIVLFKASYKVAEPDEALIVSGIGIGKKSGVQDTEGDELGFKIVSGRGALVFPGFQVARRLPLDLHSAPLQVDCVTKNGIKVDIEGTVLYKIADDPRSIANAARRFLGKEDSMDNHIHNVFSGHLRGIVGGLTVEELLTKRDSLTNETRAQTHDELAKLGLVVQSLVFHGIHDNNNYIVNLGKPEAARVEAAARIAAAEQDRQATEAEQAAAALKAAAVRESSIKRAGFQAEIDRAEAESKQAGPLAEAVAKQQVVVAETKAAELAADLTEKQLETQVRRPADAQAYSVTTQAAADRDARIRAAEAKKSETELNAEAEAKRTKIAAEAEAEATERVAVAKASATQKTGEAEAAATRAKGVAAAEAGKAQAEATQAQGLAEAAAIKARAEALATNSEAVVAQIIAEKYPEIVRAAATAFSQVDNFTVLNGAGGVTQSIGEVIGMGAAGLGVAKDLISQLSAAATDTRKLADGISPNGASDNQSTKAG